MEKEIFSTMAVSSFILGGVSLGGYYFPPSLWILKLLLPLAAIVLGIFGSIEVYKHKKKNKKLKLRGRRTSIAGIILGLIALIIFITPII